VAPHAQRRDYLGVKPGFDDYLIRRREAGIERAREVVGVEYQCVYRLLQVEAEVDVCEEEGQRPLIQLQRLPRKSGNRS